MAGIIAKAAAVFLAPALSVSTVSAAQSSKLSADDRDGINRAVLNHLFVKSGSELGSDFDYYLALQGKIPDQKFLDSIGAKGAKLKPWNLADTAQADSKKNFIGSGHNVMRVIVGGIGYDAADKVHLDVTSKCGPALCGSGDTFILQKTNGKWAVQSVRRNYNE